MKNTLRGTFMEKLNQYRKFFQKQKEIEEKGVPVTITCYSQPHVLQQRMKDERLTHDQQVVANMSPVRLEGGLGKMILYFCPMQALEITQQLKPGDGGLIPPEAQVHDLKVPQDLTPGLYTLENVIVDSNGVMNIRATKETAWKSLARENC